MADNKVYITQEEFEEYKKLKLYNDYGHINVKISLYDYVSPWQDGGKLQFTFNLNASSDFKKEIKDTITESLEDYDKPFIEYYNKVIKLREDKFAKWEEKHNEETENLYDSLRSLNWFNRLFRFKSKLYDLFAKTRFYWVINCKSLKY